jgi:hypothetical protein
MRKLSTPVPLRSRALRIGLVLSLSLPPLVVLCVAAACNDTPGPATGPGDHLIDDSQQDAVVQLTQDTGIVDVNVAPQGIAGDGGYGDGGYLEAGYSSTGYMDVQSPQMACASCTCGENRGFCLENGVTPTVTGAATDAGLCALATPTTLAIGCNPLPDSCPKPTCECILNAIQPPLGCYPECTSAAGYFDVFCAHP